MMNKINHQKKGCNFAHSVCCIGYDEEKSSWLCKNSWDDKWGEDGYFWIGYGEFGVDYKMWGIEGFTQIYQEV